MCRKAVSIVFRRALDHFSPTLLGVALWDFPFSEGGFPLRDQVPPKVPPKRVRLILSEVAIAVSLQEHLSIVACVKCVLGRRYSEALPCTRAQRLLIIVFLG